MSMFTIRNLKYQYPKSETYAVENLDFDIHQGEVFGLLGPSGAGKSTTQKILTKLLPGYQGSITFEGQELSQTGAHFYETIGVGFELPVHFNKLTGLENMRFFQNLYQQKTSIEPMLKRVGLYADKDKLVGEYSKGMKMRLNFVRAMLNQPKFLFLDEVTNGLDPKNARIIKDWIKEFKAAGGTVLLTTHLMGDVEDLCDRVAFIKSGSIIESAPPRDLKIKYGKRQLTVDYWDGSNRQSKQFDMEGIGKNADFLRLIKEVPIETMHSGETSLEDIFIQITGDSYDA